MAVGEVDSLLMCLSGYHSRRNNKEALGINRGLLVDFLKTVVLETTGGDRPFPALPSLLT